MIERIEHPRKNPRSPPMSATTAMKIQPYNLEKSILNQLTVVKTVCSILFIFQNLKIVKLKANARHNIAASPYENKIIENCLSFAKIRKICK